MLAARRHSNTRILVVDSGHTTVVLQTFTIVCVLRDIALREESTAFTWFLTSRTRSRSVAYCTSQLGNQRRQVPSRQCCIFSFGPAFDAQHKAISHNTSKITSRYVTLRRVTSRCVALCPARARCHCHESDESSQVLRSLCDISSTLLSLMRATSHSH